MHRAVVTILAASLLLLSGPVAADLDEVSALIGAQNYQAALQGLDGEPVSRHTRLLRARALAGLKRDKEAEALYRNLIAEAPADPVPYNNLATLYAASGRLQEASTLLSEAMDSDPRYAAIYKNLSHVYMEMSRNSYAKALRLSDQPQGLQLLTLDAMLPTAIPIQVAAVSAKTVQPASSTRVPVPPVKPVAEAPRSESPGVVVREPVVVAVATPVVVTPEVPQKVAPVVSRPEPRVTPGVVQREPVAVTPVVPAVASKVAESVTTDVDLGGAIAALKRWAKAWSSQNVEGYLAAYDAEYLPPRGLSLAQWRAERRWRLQKPSKIEVALSNFEVTAGGGSTLMVKALQRYRSDQYRDKTRKGFVLVLRDGVWKIGDEYTIGVIN